MNSVWFDDLIDHKNPMENTNSDTCLIDAREEHNSEDYEEEEHFEGVNEKKSMKKNYKN